MAESLSAEQIEERRTNLRAFRHSIGMQSDDELHTTLLMQEEWLATVDELHDRLAGLGEVAALAAKDSHIIRGLRLQKCLGPTGGLALECQDCYDDIAKYCAPCYLRAIHEPEGETPLPNRPVVEIPCVGTCPATDPCDECFESERKWMDGEEFEAEEPKDTDELLRRHWQSEAFDPEGEGVTEGWPDDVSWREWLEANPLRERGISLEPPFPGLATVPVAVREEAEELEPPYAPITAFVPPLDTADDRTECEVSGHIWVKMGKVGLNDHGLSAMDWGETKCLRCNEPYDVGFTGSDE